MINLSAFIKTAGKKIRSSNKATIMVLATSTPVVELTTKSENVSTIKPDARTIEVITSAVPTDLNV